MGALSYCRAATKGARERRIAILAGSVISRVTTWTTKVLEFSSSSVLANSLLSISSNGLAVGKASAAMYDDF